MQLCPNCHDLYHLICRVFIEKSKQQQRILDSYCAWAGENDARFQFLYMKMRKYHEIDKKVGQNSARVVVPIGRYMKRRIKGHFDWDFLDVQPEDEAISKRLEIKIKVQWKEDGEEVQSANLLFSIKGIRIVKVSAS